MGICILFIFFIIGSQIIDEGKQKMKQVIEEEQQYTGFEEDYNPEKFDEDIDKGNDLVVDGVNFINIGIILATSLLIVAFIFAIINSNINKKLKNGI